MRCKNMLMHIEHTLQYCVKKLIGFEIILVFKLFLRRCTLEYLHYVALAICDLELLRYGS